MSARVNFSMRVEQLPLLGRREARGAAARGHARGPADAVDVVLRRRAAGRSSRRGRSRRRRCPRAAMSVATSTRYGPLAGTLERDAALRLRAVGVDARDLVARALDAFATLSARRFVRVKTSVESSSALEQRRAAARASRAARRGRPAARRAPPSCRCGAPPPAPGRAGARARTRRPRRHRRREEQRLPLPSGRAARIRVSWGLNAHVEHPVGLVEDEDLDAVELRGPCCRWSTSRPGVATIDLVPSRSAARCSPMPTPPITSGAAHVAPAAEALQLVADLDAPAPASARGRARAGPRFAASRSMIGRRNAAVFPCRSRRCR